MLPWVQRVIWMLSCVYTCFAELSLEILILHCSVIKSYFTIVLYLEMLQLSCFFPAAFQHVSSLHSFWPLRWPPVSVTFSQLYVVFQCTSSLLPTVFSTFWKATTLYAIKNVEEKKEILAIEIIVNILYLYFTVGESRRIETGDNCKYD